MKDYQKRVVLEKEELDEKLEKLMLFITSDKFSALPDGEKFLMGKQSAMMTGYSGALADRIALFS